MARTKTTARKPAIVKPQQQPRQQPPQQPPPVEEESSSQSPEDSPPRRREGKAPIEDGAEESQTNGGEDSSESGSEEYSEEEPERFFNKVAESRVAKWAKNRDITETKVLDPNSVDFLSCQYLLDYFKDSHFDKLLTLNEPSYHDLVFQFYANLGVDRSDVNKTMVNGRIIPVDKFIINKVLGCPWIDDSFLRPNNPDGPYEIYSSYDWFKPSTSQPLDPVEMGRKYFNLEGDVAGIAEHYDVSQLSLEHRLVLEWISNNVLPSGSRVTEPTISRLQVFYYMMEKLPINPGYTILMYMHGCAKKNDKRFPYGSLITRLVKASAIFPIDRAIFPEFYDKNWFTNKKGLELVQSTGRYRLKPETEENIARVAKRKREAASSSGRGKNMLAKLGKLFACFKSQVEAQKVATAKLKKDMEDHIEDNNLEIELSEDAVEPTFDDVPVSSGEEEEAQ